MMAEQAMRATLVWIGFSNVVETFLAAGNGEGMTLKGSSYLLRHRFEDMVSVICKPGGQILGIVPPGAPAGAQALMILNPGFQTPLHV